MNYLIAFISGILLSYAFQYFPFLTSLLLLLSSIFLILNKRTILTVLVLAGILYGLLRHETFQVKDIGGRQLEVNFLVKERDSWSSSSGILYRGEIINATDIQDNRTLEGLEGKDALLLSGIELGRKEVYSMIVRVSPNRMRNNPGSYKEKSITLYLEKDKGIERVSSGTIHSALKTIQKVIENERERLDGYLKSRSSESGAFLSSIITGKRSGLGEDIRESFSRTGLAHILSISGTHFGLLSTFIFFLIKSSISFLPHPLLRRLTIYLTPSQFAAILSLPFLILYLLISGASIPAIRSFIMINIFLFGLLMSRRGYWLNSLLFAAFLLLLWDPSSFNDISFQLSFIAVLFLGYSLKETDRTESQDTERGQEGLLKVIPGRFKKAFLMSLSVSFGTAPLIDYYFHYLSIIAPLVNILLTPLICLIILPFALLSSFLFVLIGYFPFERLLISLTDLTINIVKSLSSLTFSALPAGELPVGLVILFYTTMIAFILITSHPASPRKPNILGKKEFLSILCVAALIPVFLPGMLQRDLSITFLDVGQGDSTVIEAPNGRTFIVDTGKTGREVESYLRFRGRDSIDAIILTHADNDHSGGLQRLIKRFRVREIWDNGLLLYPVSLKTPVRRLEKGDLIESEGLEMLVLHPYNGFYSSREKGGNEYSLVVKIKGKRGASILLAADIEEEAEEDLLHLNGWLRSKVIKISHHGSRHSSSEAFLDAVSPEIAIISVGRENPFGHPHDEVIGRLSEKGVRLYRTDMYGAIKLTEREKGFNVKTFFDYALEKTTGLKSELRNLRRLFQTW